MKNPDSPWPDLATAQHFFRQLAGLAPAAPTVGLTAAPLATWLILNEIGPMAYYRFKGIWPELAAELRQDALAAAAENRIHLAALERALAALQPAGIPTLIFKGASIIHYYAAPGLRTMSDVDFWIQPDQIETAISTLLAAGFQTQFPHKPAQLSHSGKLKLIHPQLPSSGLELHAYPYTGQWLLNAAAIDQDLLWQRRQPLQLGACLALQPEATDLFLHAAIHLSVNHQFDRSAFRAFLDLATLAQNHRPDWSELANRAQQWDLQTALWLPLWLLNQLFGLLDEVDILERLAPAAWRQALLTHWLDPATLLAGKQLDSNLRRRLYLLLLCDRPGRLPRLLAPRGSR